MRRVYIAIFCVLGLLVVFYPLTVNGGQLAGVWAFDVEATVALMRESGNLPAPLAEVRARLERTNVTIDVMQKRFLVSEEGREKESGAITMISEQGGVLTLHKKGKPGGQFRFLDDGRLEGIENGKAVFVLKRVR